MHCHRVLIQGRLVGRVHCTHIWDETTLTSDPSHNKLLVCRILSKTFLALNKMKENGLDFNSEIANLNCKFILNILSFHKLSLAVGCSPRCSPPACKTELAQRRESNEQERRWGFINFDNQNDSFFLVFFISHTWYWNWGFINFDNQWCFFLYHTPHIGIEIYSSRFISMEHDS